VNYSRRRRKNTPNYKSQSLFEVAVEIKTFKTALKITIWFLALLFAILAFFGLDRYNRLEERIIEKIDPQKKIRTLDSLIVGVRPLLKKLEKYEKFIPVGTIVAFDGKMKLSDEWTICNGDTIHIRDGKPVSYVNDSTFITPDLVNRFILGTTLQDDSYSDLISVGSTGGLKVHSHDFELNAQTTLNQTSSVRTGVLMRTTRDITVLPYRADHSHNIITSNVTEESSNLPPYYSLIFIIKYR